VTTLNVYIIELNAHIRYVFKKRELYVKDGVFMCPGTLSYLPHVDSDGADSLMLMQIFLDGFSLFCVVSVLWHFYIFHSFMFLMTVGRPVPFLL